MPSISKIALKHNRLMLAVVIGLMLFGIVSYQQLPAQEDPKITIREAVITTNYPGMPAEKIELLVTKTIEEAIRKLPQIHEIRSVSMPGTSIIHAETVQTVPGEELSQVWDELRNEIEAVQGGLPQGTGPYIINDDFGDVAVLTVALVADESFGMGERQDMAQHIADMMFKVDGVKKIDILGIQEERIFIETSNTKLAQLGISPNELITAIQNQNIIRPGGIIDADGRNFTIQPTGNFDSVEDIRQALISIPGQEQTIALQDIADIKRTVIDPPLRTAYYNGRQAIVFAIAKNDTSDVLKFTPAMEEMIAKINADIPAGYELQNITRQADVVKTAVYGVSLNVVQTLVIVLIVVIMFLGVRTGLIVGSIVPGVVLITLSIMNFCGIPLERMSLATLIIALGLLVDNGIVVAEDFKKRLEEGERRDDALDNAGGTLAVPLLTSSLTTILVFLPLMLAQSKSGEYTRSISLVILISLMVSWVLCLTMTPYLCHKFIKIPKKDGRNRKPGKVQSFFDNLNPFYEKTLRTTMKARPVFLILIILLFLTGGWAMGLVPVKFFPDSDRSQVLIYLDMPAGTSMRETDSTIQEICTRIQDKKRFPHIEKFAAYGGFGGPRFVLSLTPIDQEPSKGFFMIDVGAREHAEQTIKEIRKMLETEFPNVFGRVTKMFLGPSDSSLIEVQIKGPQENYIYDIAKQIEGLLDDIDGAYDIKNNWENRVTEIQIRVNQQNARRAGVSSFDIAQSLQTYFSGRGITEFREGDDIFPIVLRAKDSERFDLDRIQSVNVYSQSRDANVPLMQVADVNLKTAFARKARENLFRTITVEAKNRIMSAENMAPLLEPGLEKIRESLPPAYEIEYDGVIQDSKESKASLNANLPLCLAIIVILLIGQFRSFRRAGIILMTVPLIIIGASAGLLTMRANFGFMEILGLYALAGIIINNAIVLIDRIDIERRELLDHENEKELSAEERNQNNYEAVISASVRRLRPIVMSTTTTILGLMPLILSKDALFYGLASAISFGLAVGTVFTLGFVPVLYTYFFKLKPTPEDKHPGNKGDHAYAN
ncbi:MAG: efflux RND transporter permease subunit [Desulfobacterales bacterium]|nr:efflux RND transporter permease subunit [Desulfobacterales bacterium]